jgi:hypothetical protein
MNRNTMRGAHHGLLAVGFVLIACAAAHAQNITSNYVPGTDFSKYHTYKWVAIEGTQHPDQIVDAQIKQAVDSVLAGKGFTKATGDTADLLVGYQVAVNQEKQWNAYGTGMGFRMGGGMGTATSSTINIGTLGLDVYDSAAKQLIWRGSATKTMNPSKDAEKNQEKLTKAVEKLLKEFPPGK